mgnify:CR=1 FL=1
MKFQNLFLWPLLFLPLVYMGVRLLNYYRRKRCSERFVERSVWDSVIGNISYTRRFWKGGLFTVILGLVILCLLRPQYGKSYDSVVRKGNSIFFVLDTSLSMMAEDVSPNRFERAKLEIISLLEQLKGDKVGLILMSGDSYIQCPLTMDYAAFRLFLEDVYVGIIPQSGSNLASSIQLALNAFKDVRGQGRGLVVFTDGEHFEGDLDGMIKKAKQEQLRVFTVGVGSDKGEPIPMINKQGQKAGYKKDKEGKVVMSRVNVTDLKRMAVETKGAFFFSTNVRFVSDTLYEVLSQYEKDRLEEQFYERYQDRYQYVLWLVLLLLLVDTFVCEMKQKSRFLSFSWLLRRKV